MGTRTVRFFGTGQCPEGRNPSGPAYTVFSDQGDPISTGAPPYPSDFQPRQPLSALAGSQPAGNWVLTVRDGQGAADGKILCAYVRFSIDNG